MDLMVLAEVGLFGISLGFFWGLFSSILTKMGWGGPGIGFLSSLLRSILIWVAAQFVSQMIFPAPVGLLFWGSVIVAWFTMGYFERLVWRIIG